MLRTVAAAGLLSAACALPAGRVVETVPPPERGLSILRSSVELFRRSTGRFPRDRVELRAAVSKFGGGKGLPDVKVPEHSLQHRVELYDPSIWRALPAGPASASGPWAEGELEADQLRDSGAWGYEPNSGHAFVDCTHPSDSGRWYER
ncbi:MAG: hypothetical protein HY553_02420 [Elusimicrobia bacterium]|nr:hypothetical protein [Elusimicrobiota bacterium]